MCKLCSPYVANNVNRAIAVVVFPIQMGDGLPLVAGAGGLLLGAGAGFIFAAGAAA